jgi:hypothetical protein
MQDTKGVPLNQWSNTVLTRVSKLPPPYGWHFGDWLQKQVGIGQLDSATLANALEGLDVPRQQGLMSSIQAILQATEQTFGGTAMTR